MWHGRWAKILGYSFVRTFAAYSSIVTVVSFFIGSFAEMGIQNSVYFRFASIVSILILLSFWVVRGKKKYVRRRLLWVDKIGDRWIYSFENDPSLKEGTVIQIMERKGKNTYPFAIAVVDSEDELDGRRMKVQHYCFIGNNFAHVKQEEEELKRFFYYPHLKITGFELMHKN